MRHDALTQLSDTDVATVALLDVLEPFQTDWGFVTSEMLTPVMASIRVNLELTIPAHVHGGRKTPLRALLSHATDNGAFDNRAAAALGRRLTTATNGLMDGSTNTPRSVLLKRTQLSETASYPAQLIALACHLAIAVTGDIRAPKDEGLSTRFICACKCVYHLFEIAHKLDLISGATSHGLPQWVSQLAKNAFTAADDLTDVAAAIRQARARPPTASYLQSSLEGLNHIYGLRFMQFDPQPALDRSAEMFYSVAGPVEGTIPDYVTPAFSEALAEYAEAHNNAVNDRPILARLWIALSAAAQTQKDAEIVELVKQVHVT